MMAVTWKPMPRPLNPYEIAAFYSGNVDALPSPPRLNIAVQKMEPTPADAVRCAVEAEERIFTRAFERYDDRASRDRSEYPMMHGHDPLNSVVISNCNVQGMRNRRSAGNVVGMHPALAGRLTLLEREDETMVGRWRRIGTLNTSINVFVSDHMPRDQFICATNGALFTCPNRIDGAGVLLDHEGDLFVLTPAKERRDDGSETQHEVSNYLTLVRI